jgi:hypothetical protein
VLAESTLYFCWLIRFVFEEADPKPQAIRITVGFDNLKRPSGPAVLSDVPEGKMRIGTKPKSAPASSVEVFQLVDLAQYDAERVAYLLMADIYNWFGFDAAQVPYADATHSEPKLHAALLVGAPLPDTVPTSGFC